MQCHQPIPEARLKALPHAKTCVQCSSTQKVVGFPMVTGKTEYSAIQVLSAEDAERLRRLDRRSGYGSNLKFDENGNGKP